jgi:hypothetical protein
MQQLCKILFGALVGYKRFSLPNQGFNRHENIGCAISFVLVVFPWWLPFHHWQRAMWRVMQGLAAFIYAYQRAFWVIRTLIYFQNVFHLRYKLRGRLGDHPRLYEPRLKFIFFSRFITATSLILSSNFNSTSLSASNCNVQRAFPSGGALQARSVNCASISPVIFGIAPGRGCHISALSNPPSTNFLRMAVMVGREHSKNSRDFFRAYFLFLVLVSQQQNPCAGLSSCR